MGLQHRRFVSLFYSQLAALLGSGVPLAVSLDILSGFPEDRILRETLQHLLKTIHSGSTFSHAMKSHPATFSPVAVALVRAGETSGGLHRSMEHLARWSERDHRLLGRTMSALAYPLFTLGVIAFLTLVMAVWVLPQFAEVFEEMHLALPWPTRLLLWTCQRLANPGSWLVLAGVGLLLGQAWSELRRDRSRMTELYRRLSRVPLLGPVWTALTLAQFTRCLALLLENGISLLPALDLAVAASGNPYLQARRSDLREGLTSGQHLSGATAAIPDLFPRMVSSFLVAGEESGSLSGQLAQLAHFFEFDLDQRLERFTALIEPVLVSGVAVVVGGMVLAMLGPMYAAINSL